MKDRQALCNKKSFSCFISKSLNYDKPLTFLNNISQLHWFGKVRLKLQLSLQKYFLLFDVFTVQMVGKFMPKSPKI